MSTRGPAPDDYADPGDRLASGPATLEITNAMVRLFRDHTGRGPTKAKTLMSEDLAIVTFQDCLTPVEAGLAGNGHRPLAAQWRAALYEVMRADAMLAVEEITGRPVAAYMTGQHHDPDMAVAVFVFAPDNRPEAA